MLQKCKQNLQQADRSGKVTNTLITEEMVGTRLLLRKRKIGGWHRTRPIMPFIFFLGKNAEIRKATFFFTVIMVSETTAILSHPKVTIGNRTK